MLHNYHVNVIFGNFGTNKTSVENQFIVSENGVVIKQINEMVSLSQVELNYLTPHDAAVTLMKKVEERKWKILKEFKEADYNRERSEIIAEFIKQLGSSAKFEDDNLVLQITIKGIPDKIIKLLEQKGD